MLRNILASLTGCQWHPHLWDHICLQTLLCVAWGTTSPNPKPLQSSTSPTNFHIPLVTLQSNPPPPSVTCFNAFLTGLLASSLLSLFTISSSQSNRERSLKSEIKLPLCSTSPMTSQHYLNKVQSPHLRLQSSAWSVCRVVHDLLVSNFS